MTVQLILTTGDISFVDLLEDELRHPLYVSEAYKFNMKFRVEEDGAPKQCFALPIPLKTSTSPSTLVLTSTEIILNRIRIRVFNSRDSKKVVGEV